MTRPDLPQLDLLIGFEAAARHLSFTKAAAELFRTQSTISRQVQLLEQQVGTPLFQRRHRALELTDAGQLLYRGASEAIGLLQETTQRICGIQSSHMLVVTTLVSLASLWLVPRMCRFRALHPQIDVRVVADNAVVDLRREGIDVAIRYMSPQQAPASAHKLFDEEVLPVCAPQLLKDRARPLRVPADLRHHTLLHDDMSDVTPWLEWETWLESHGIGKLRPAGELHLPLYEQTIRAAVAGQGVALGRLPLLGPLIADGSLVVPFSAGPGRSMPSRALFVMAEAAAAMRPDVQAFIGWVIAESGPGPQAQDAPRAIERRVRERRRAVAGAAGG